jgi:hypothetical protein
MMPSSTSAGTPLPIDGNTLRYTAFDMTVERLQQRGNVLSENHRRALYQMCSVMTGQAVSGRGGRVVIGAVTGAGKTTVLTNFVGAIDRLGYPLAISCSASQLEHLGDIYDELVDLGVPREKIGFKHSLSDKQAAAIGIIPSTGSESFPYQLVTHSRIRSKSRDDIPLYTMHEGQRRSLCLWDESLMRSASVGIDIRKLWRALDNLTGIRNRKENTEVRFVALVGYIEDCLAALDLALKQDDPRGVGVTVNIPARDASDIYTYIDYLSRRFERESWGDSLIEFLSISQGSIRAVRTYGGQGVVWCEDRVPKELDSVVSFDGSYSVRRLLQLDPSLTEVEDVGGFKRYDNVTVTQIETKGSRTALEALFAESSSRRKVTCAENSFAKEVVALVKRESEAKALLLFVYKARGVNFAGSVLRALEDAGVDTEATVEVNGEQRKRINVLTWGQHDSTNKVNHCDVVILCGILHRGTADVSAAIKGQVGNIDHPTPKALLEDVIDSEKASLVYQALSRGASRTTIDGQAAPSRIYLWDANGCDLERRLRPVLPGVTWQYEAPTHIKVVDKAEAVTKDMAFALQRYLKALPPNVMEVTSRSIKSSMGIRPDDKSKENAFTRAGKKLPEGLGWIKEGGWFRRVVGSDRGFHNEEILDAAVAF